MPPADPGQLQCRAASPAVLLLSMTLYGRGHPSGWHVSCPLPASCPPQSCSLGQQCEKQRAALGHRHIVNAILVSHLKHSSLWAPAKKIFFIPAMPSTPSLVNRVNVGFQSGGLAEVYFGKKGKTQQSRLTGCLKQYASKSISFCITIFSLD